MTARGYEQFSAKRLRQGDIAHAYVHQLVPRSGGGRAYPGDETFERLPDYGAFDEIRPEGADYVIRVWTLAVIVVTQNCELERSHKEDSRVVVAPLFMQEAFGDEPFWQQLASNRIPGYHFICAMSGDEAAELGLDGPMPASVVDFSGLSVTSRDLIKPRRFAKLHQDMLVAFQDSYVRASTVRGLAPIAAIMGGGQDIRGMTIQDVRDTSITASGPLRIAKVYLRGDEDDDELEVSWGFRPSRD